MINASKVSWECLNIKSIMVWFGIYYFSEEQPNNVLNIATSLQFIPGEKKR